MHAHENLLGRARAANRFRSSHPPGMRSAIAFATTNSRVRWWRRRNVSRRKASGIDLQQPINLVEGDDDLLAAPEPVLAALGVAPRRPGEP